MSVWYTEGWALSSVGGLLPEGMNGWGVVPVFLLVGSGFVLMARVGGVCFQRLTVITCPNAYSVLLRRRVWAPVPSGSSKETERDEMAPVVYLVGSRTQEGFWVMVREA